jgi:hypothetical protein
MHCTEQSLIYRINRRICSTTDFENSFQVQDHYEEIREKKSRDAVIDLINVADIEMHADDVM